MGSDEMEFHVKIVNFYAIHFLGIEVLRRLQTEFYRIPENKSSNNV